jgi:hypothetical protein
MTVAPQAVCQRPGRCEEQALPGFTDLPLEEEIMNPPWGMQRRSPSCLAKEQESAARCRFLVIDSIGS